MDDWIAKLDNFLRAGNWNSELAKKIQDYLNVTEHNRGTIDSLLMTSTKVVETHLREVLEQFIGKASPTEKRFGTNLLNYAKTENFIPEPSKNEVLYYLIYWFFKKPRNLTHHVFTDYPLSTDVMFISSANYILNEIDRLNTHRNYFKAKTTVDYDYTSRNIVVTVAEIEKDDEIVNPPRLDVVLIDPTKATSTHSLQKHGERWETTINAYAYRGGTYSANFFGYDKKENRFDISGSSIVVIQ